MTPEPGHILLLAGTFEARQLARHIADAFPQTRVTASFAGAVKDLPDLGVPTRIGGFGGEDGLASFIRSNGVTVIIDATHPFAARMSRNAHGAAHQMDVPLVRLERPPWQPAQGDTWIHAATMAEAAAAIPAGAHAFLAVGRKDIATFTHRRDIRALVRMIEPPAQPLPDHWALILARPPQESDAEAALFQTHGITHVVTKNSGGQRAVAKIDAARALGLPVLMIGRPELPPAICAATPAAIIARLRDILS